MEDILCQDVCDIINIYKNQIETYEAHRSKMKHCLDWIARLEIKDSIDTECVISTTIKMFRSSPKSKSLYFYSVSSWCRECGDKVLTDYFDFIDRDRAQQSFCICDHFGDDIEIEVEFDMEFD